jgi:hypothetical protein
MALSLAWEWTDKSVPLGKYCLKSRLVFSFDPRCHALPGRRLRSNLPRGRLRITEVDINVGCKREARVICELFATIPCQRFVELTRQLPSRLDQRSDDTLGVLVRDFH